MTVAERIRRQLDALAPTRVDLLDESAQHAGHAGAAPGGNTHWKLTIVSAAFEGKPTVLYWFFAGALAVSATLFRKNLIRSMLAKEIRLPEPVWARLNWSWVAFFVLMGCANLYVAFNYEEPTWVKFKLIGGTGLMLLFVVGQALFLARHIEEESKP